MSTREELYGNDWAADGPDRPEPYEYADLDPSHPEAYQHGSRAITECPECGDDTVVAVRAQGIRACRSCWWTELAEVSAP